MKCAMIVLDLLCRHFCSILVALLFAYGKEVNVCEEGHIRKPRLLCRSDQTTIFEWYQKGDGPQEITIAMNCGGQQNFLYNPSRITSTFVQQRVHLWRLQVPYSSHALDKQNKQRKTENKNQNSTECFVTSCQFHLLFLPLSYLALNVLKIKGIAQ